MKILFIGSTRQTALALHYFTSFVRLGHLVLPFDPDFFYSNHWLERFSTKIFKTPNLKRQRQVSTQILELFQKHRFDLVFVMAENFVTAELLKEIRSSVSDPPCLVYHSHDNNFSEGILKPPGFFETLRSYDYVFTTKSQNVGLYQSLGQSQTYFIPSAYEPSIHRPISAAESAFGNHQIEVSFVGTFDRSRVSYVEAVGWDSLAVWGDRWKKYSGYSKHKQQITPRAIYGIEFADVLSHSRCALGLLREEANDLHTTRTFEIPACGALQFAPHNPEVSSFFKNGEEIILFDSPSDLKDKLTYYLKHDWQRAQIARRGHERCLRDRHTYLDRVQTILSTLAENELTV